MSGISSVSSNNAYIVQQSVSASKPENVSASESNSVTQNADTVKISDAARSMSEAAYSKESVNGTKSNPVSTKNNTDIVVFCEADRNKPEAAYVKKHLEILKKHGLSTTSFYINELKKQVFFMPNDSNEIEFIDITYSDGKYRFANPPEMPPTADPEQWIYAQDIPPDCLDHLKGYLNKGLKYNVIYHEPTNPIEKEIVDNFKSVIKDYNAGGKTVEELQQCFKDTYTAILKHNVALGRTSGDNMKDNLKILNETYKYFVERQINTAQNSMFDKGKQIAMNYGANKDTWGGDWAYYDADYYYAHLDAMNGLKDIVGKIADEKGLDKGKIDSSFIRKNYDNLFAISYGNTVTKIDSSVPPPRGFTLFFKETKYSADDFKYGQKLTLGASDPNAKTDQTGAATYNFTVPRGAKMFKNIQNKTLLDYIYSQIAQGRRIGHGDNHNGIIIDVNPLLGEYKQADLWDRVKAFFYDTFENYEAGVLIIGNNGKQTVYDVPFYEQNNREEFNVAEVVSSQNHSDTEAELSYLKNFQVFTYSYGYFSKMK